MAIKKRKGSSISVDFTGVQAGGGRALPDGTYTVEVQEVTEEESSEGNPYLKFVYHVAEGQMKGARVWDNVSLQPQALWRFKTLLECFEIEADGSTDIDLEDLKGKQVDVEVTNETWEGKQRPKISGFLGGAGAASKSNEEETEEEEEEFSPKKAGSQTSKKSLNKSKFKVGQKVSFKDDKNKTLKGVLTAVSDTDCVVDVSGEEWDLEVSDITAL